MVDSRFRTETDSMGEVQVPTHALYGAQTQRAVDNFPLSGICMSRAFIRALGLVKAACALANAELGLLEPKLAEAIAEAAVNVSRGTYDNHFPVDVFQTGSGTSSNMNANEVIAALATELVHHPVHPNDQVNMSQSSNDVIPTCIHLSAALLLHDRLLPALDHLARVIENRAIELDGVTKTGRTHLMDAMPVTFDQELSGWLTQIRQSQHRLESVQPRLHRLAIGGTAVGTGVNAPDGFAQRVCTELSQQTGLALQPAGNHFEALSCQDTAVELSGQLKTLAVALIKICNDLRWANSGPLAGLADLRLPALQPGSSIMPGKVNPVIPEAVAMACTQVIGNDSCITMAGQSGNFQLNVMLPLVAHNLIQSLELLTNSAVLLANKAIKGFVVNSEQIDQALASNPILVTALNRVIGYEQGAAIAKQAYAEKRPLLEVALEVTGMDEAELKRLLDPQRLTGKKTDS
ncbi:class II fumarate hydratase [Motiliproteus coralliicola]|uniref:Fumarate hydratase class II n=1 Tax=Motiliproteus coralliicola TaxID=2283196 RepID=A0A369WST1_9GAMM|nr:class II fumarate hydratase [Motiliproteus coralliicola]RDE24631.1 class II fumarate hydratase [Motiliproteus coralliicola]